MADGTITGAITRIQGQQGRPQVVKVTLTCTASADAHTYPATVVNTLDNVSDYDLRGLSLHSVKAIPGTTGPTDNSDLTITDENGVDLLGGKGENIIDNATLSFVPAGPGAFAQPAPITGNITVNLSGNSVDSAVVTLVLLFVGI